MNTFTKIILSLLCTSTLCAAEPKRTIVIDPGHEPWNKGTSWYKSGEAGANIKFSLALEDIIEKEDKYDVIITTREEGYNPLLYSVIKNNHSKKKKKIKDTWYFNYYKMLYARALFFQIPTSPVKADLFVSVHHNEPDGNNSSLHGFCIYYSKNGRHASESKELAIKIKDALVTNGYKKSTNAGENKGYQNAEFIVIRKANSSVPAVLMELGYISNKKDKQDAYNDEAVEKKAKVVYQALDDFLSRRK